MYHGESVIEPRQPGLVNGDNSKRAGVNCVNGDNGDNSDLVNGRRERTSVNRGSSGGQVLDMNSSRWAKAKAKTKAAAAEATILIRMEQNGPKSGTGPKDG